MGSSYYGEAITDLPQLEAVPDDSNLMKYTLMTMDRNTIFLPKITSINETYTLENQNSKQKISPNTENSSDTSYHFVFNNISGLNSKIFFISPISNSYGLSELLVKATPLAIIALGLSYCFKNNIYNIGAEGQLTMGAIFGLSLIHI